MADPGAHTLDDQKSLQKLIKTPQHDQLLTTNWSLAEG